MATKINENLMLVDFKKLNITNIEYTKTKIKVDTEKYFYLLSEDSTNLYLVRERFINNLFACSKVNVATFNVEAMISTEELTIESISSIDNAYFIDEDKYFIFSEREVISDSSELFISGYFNVSDELIELKKTNDSKFIGLIDKSVKYAYKIQINDDDYIKINASYLNLKSGSKVKLYGKFNKNNNYYLGANEINFENQVTSLESNILFPVYPYILNIRDFSDINTSDSKFDISGFNIISENTEVTDDKTVINFEDIQTPEDIQTSEDNNKEVLEEKQKPFWTFDKIVFVGLVLFAAYIILF